MARPLYVYLAVACVVLAAFASSSMSEAEASTVEELDLDRQEEDTHKTVASVTPRDNNKVVDLQQKLDDVTDKLDDVTDERDQKAAAVRSMPRPMIEGMHAVMSKRTTSCLSDKSGLCAASSRTSLGASASDMVGDVGQSARTPSVASGNVGLTAGTLHMPSSTCTTATASCPDGITSRGYWTGQGCRTDDPFYGGGCWPWDGRAATAQMFCRREADPLVGGGALSSSVKAVSSYYCTTGSVVPLAGRGSDISLFYVKRVRCASNECVTYKSGKCVKHTAGRVVWPTVGSSGYTAMARKAAADVTNVISATGTITSTCTDDDKAAAADRLSMV